MKNDAKFLLDFLKITDRLENLPRTGYFFAGIRQPETLAAHAFGVVVITMILIDHMTETVDKERALRMAILHDMTEALLTDIPNSIFKYLSKEQKLLAENKTAEELFKDLDESYLEIWREFETGETLEARIVRCADKLQLALKILTYTRDGVGHFQSLWVHDAEKHDWWGIEPARKIYEEILGEFDNQNLF